MVSREIGQRCVCSYLKKLLDFVNDKYIYLRTKDIQNPLFRRSQTSYKEDPVFTDSNSLVHRHLQCELPTFRVGVGINTFFNLHPFIHTETFDGL